MMISDAKTPISASGCCCRMVLSRSGFSGKISEIGEHELAQPASLCFSSLTRACRSRDTAYVRRVCAHAHMDVCALQCTYIFIQL